MNRMSHKNKELSFLRILIKMPFLVVGFMLTPLLLIGILVTRAAAAAGSIIRDTYRRF